MGSASKKVIVRRFSGEVLAGYLPASSFVRLDRSGFGPSQVDLLDLSGRVVPVSLDDVKMVSYVREFNLADRMNPERLLRRSFLARPRAEGLWLRLIFRSGDLLEGLASADLTFLTSVLEDGGVFLTPPDTRSNTQRIFVPRTAMTEMQVVAVITTPSRKRPLVPDDAASLQETLFASLSPTTRPN